MESVFNSILQVVSVAEVLATTQAQLPTLILTYSAIDAMGWLYAGREDAGGAGFRAWVDRYLLAPGSTLRCTSDELYAARCGVVHTSAADSPASAAGTRKIVYAWGEANAEVLQQHADQSAPGEWVAVHIAALTGAVRLGIAQMYDDSLADPALAARFAGKEGRYFAHVGVVASMGGGG